MEIQTRTPGLLAADDAQKQVSKVFRAALRDSDLAVKDVAALLGLKDHSSVSNLFNGKRNMTLRTLSRVAHVLGKRLVFDLVDVEVEV